MYLLNICHKGNPFKIFFTLKTSLIKTTLVLPKINEYEVRTFI